LNSNVRPSTLSPPKRRCQNAWLNTTTGACAASSVSPNTRPVAAPTCSTSKKLASTISTQIGSPRAPGAGRRFTRACAWAATPPNVLSRRRHSCSAGQAMGAMPWTRPSWSATLSATSAPPFGMAGNGLRTMLSIQAKTVVLAPTPRPIERTAVMVSAGLRHSALQAWRRSLRRVSMPRKTTAGGARFMSSR
jgi:hypothetical protein